MKIFILTICISFYVLLFCAMTERFGCEKKIDIVIENQLKILNIITMDKVDTNFQLEDLENKIKELEK